MNDIIRTYRVKLPLGMDPLGTHPEFVISATTPEDAKREAWAATRWPAFVRDASDLDAVEAHPSRTPIPDKPRPEG